MMALLEVGSDCDSIRSQTSVAWCFVTAGVPWISSLHQPGLAVCSSSNFDDLDSSKAAKDAIAGDLGLGAGPMTNDWKASAGSSVLPQVHECQPDR